MTIEFWPRSLLKPRAKPKRPPKKPKPRRPKLPITAGKAAQMLSTAIMCGDHELASWIDHAVKTDRVIATPKPKDLLSMVGDDRSLRRLTAEYRPRRYGQ